MKAAYDQYDSAMRNIERYKGSEGYGDEKAKLDAQLNEMVKIIKDEYSPRFDSVVRDLKMKVGHVGLAAPTSEQLNLLSLMKLQSTINKDSLVLAVRTLANSPLALNALHDIAKETGQHFWPWDENTRNYCSLDTANRICNTLNDRLVNLVHYMERPGDYKRYVNDPQVPTQLIAYDKDFDTVKACFMAFADIDSDQFDAFFDFISGRDMTNYVINISERALAAAGTEADENQKSETDCEENQNAQAESENQETYEEHYAQTRGFAADALANAQTEIATQNKNYESERSDSESGLSTIRHLASTFVPGNFGKRMDQRALRETRKVEKLAKDNWDASDLKGC